MKTILSLLMVFSIATHAQEGKTAAQYIDNIITATKAAEIPDTNDVIKEGNPNTIVTGIASCMFATMEVLQKAVEAKCNLIITHEPLYYNHKDDTGFFKGDAVYEEKKKFILDHGLVVWRFHDYIHSIQPDGIMTGTIKKLGWEKNLVAGSGYFFDFPEQTLEQFLAGLKATFPDQAFHVVGNPKMKLTHVAYAPGASGTNRHITALRMPNVDVVVAGEVPQWETYEYVRDAVTQGKNKAIIFIGHINSEESGMEYCKEWLQAFISDVPIHFIPCKSSYWTY